MFLTTIKVGFLEVEKLVLDCNVDVEVQVFHHMLIWYGFFLIEG